MLALAFVVSFLFVCGFYAYVFVHLERERKRLSAHKRNLPDHLYEIRQEPSRKPNENQNAPNPRPRAAISAKTRAKTVRRNESLSRMKLAARA